MNDSRIPQIPILALLAIFAILSKSATDGRAQTNPPPQPESGTLELEGPDQGKHANARVSIEKTEGAIVVRFGDDLFTRYDYSSYSKPVLYPVFGPRQIPMTRSWPMKSVAGEANDHPHHKSIWLGHEINGVDFWSEKTGAVKHQSIVGVDSENGSFEVDNQWVSKLDESIVCTETSAFHFGADSDKRWIDASFTFHASQGDVTFEDTKEGMFAIRMHPNLRLSPDEKRGVKQVFGNAMNSQGQSGKRIWGQNASWVYYWGEINGQAIGIAMFDHPSNLRHPTTWHAREYGLVAANPFGLHHFKNEPKGAGALTVKKGEQIRFRYRIVFHLGQQTAAELNRQFDEFAAQ